MDSTADTPSVGERTRRDILETGVRLWSAGVDPSARRIASELSITHAAVLYHFNSVALKKALAFHAVKTGNSRVIVQLIGLRDAAVANMGDTERMSHMMASR